MNKLVIYLIFILFFSLVSADIETQPEIELISSTNVDERVFNIRLDTNINCTCKFSTNNINYSEMSNEFITENNLRHTVSQRIQNEGNYDYYIACKNNLNETLITYKKIRIKVDFGDEQEIYFRPVSTRTSDDLSSNIISRRWAFPEINKNYDWKIDLSDFSIIEINFKSLSREEIELKITKLLIEPIERYKKEKLVYEYYGIEKNDDINLNKINIKFKIPLTWFKINDIKKEEITLFRFDENKDEWILIETNNYFRDKNYYYFESKINGFGFFAISFNEIEIKDDNESIINEINELKDNNLNTILDEIELQNKTLKNITINETLVNQSLINDSYEKNHSKYDDIDYLLSLMEEETKDYEINHPNSNLKILWFSLIVLFVSIFVSILFLQRLIKDKKNKQNKKKNNNEKKLNDNENQTNEKNYLEILNKYKDQNNNEKINDNEKQTNEKNYLEILNKYKNQNNNENTKNNNLKEENNKIEKDKNKIKEIDENLFSNTLNSPEYFEHQLEKNLNLVKKISKEHNEIKQIKKKPFESTDEFIIKKYIKTSFMKNIDEKQILKSLIDKGYKKENLVKLIDKIKHQIELNNRLSNIADKLKVMIENEK